MSNTNFSQIIGIMGLTGLLGVGFGEPTVRYSNVEIDLTYVSIADLAALGLPVDHHDADGKTLTLPLSQFDVGLLRSQKIGHRVLIEDYARYVELRNIAMAKEAPAPSNPAVQPPLNFNHGSMGGYLVFAQVVAELDEMRTKFPNLVSAKFEIGKSGENRSIWAIRISNTPDVENPNKRRIAYNTLTHPREPMAMMSMMWFLWTVLETYATDATMKNLVDNIELYYIPVVNPDGFEYNRSTNPNGGGLWRKNRVTNSDGTRGVDVNRNYSVNWGNNAGSSGTPSSDTFRGTGPISEKESQAVSTFYLRIKPLITSNYHTYANKILHPYGVGTRVPANMAPYTALCTDMTRVNGWEFGRVPPTIGYEAAGIEIDWGHDVLKSIAINPEQGTTADGGFWPPESRIDGMAQVAYDMNLAMMRYVMTIPVALTPGREIASNFRFEASTSRGLLSIRYKLEDTENSWIVAVKDLLGKEYKSSRLSPSETMLTLSQSGLPRSLYIVEVRKCGNGGCQAMHNQKLILGAN